MSKKHIQFPKSLTDQAEQINTLESYKVEVDLIRNASYHDLFYMLHDAELVLTVLLRREAKGNDSGLKLTIKRLVEFGKLYLEQGDLQYTYEFVEREKREKVLEASTL